MPVEKKDPTFIERFVLPLLGVFLVAPLLGCAIMFGVKLGHERLQIVLFCALIVVMVVVLAVLHHRVLGHYRCPQCQAELPRHKDPARPAEYLFYCQKCDVLWKTGLREGE